MEDLSNSEKLLLCMMKAVFSLNEKIFSNSTKYEFAGISLISVSSNVVFGALFFLK